MNRAKVYLVGAGPMNEKLITLKGIECIKKADVILYDRLVNESLLKYAKRNARLIFVGKSRESRVSQERINRLLVDNVSGGKIVVRLKGGDPFLFGRGGEEAFALKKAGVEFEVVNGVSSSIACPGFAGIPLTFRNVSSAVTIVTGQEDPCKEESSIDWNRIYSPEHTLVILMGMANLENIVEKLKDCGASPETSVAVIQEGTTPCQKVVSGNLSNIADKVSKEKMRPPCIIIIGEVVKLRKELSWAKSKLLPLRDKNILVVSTRESFYRIKSLLDEKGAKTFYLEVVRIVPPTTFESIDTAVNEIEKYRWIVFTSRNAVKFFMARLGELNKDIRSLNKSKIAVIGPQTAKELNKFFIKPDIIPEKFSSRGLIDSFSKITLNNQKMLLLRADKASGELSMALKNMGAKPDEVKMYEIRRVRPALKEWNRAFNEKIDMIVFTSSENAKSFFAFRDKFKFKTPDVIGNKKVVCLGKPTKDTLERYGFKCLTPEKYTFSDMAESMADFYKEVI